MKWIKKALIFRPSGEGGWMKSHAQIPTVLALGDRLRVYFSSRPQPSFSLTTFVDVAIDDPTRILYLHETPILEPGPPGAFDEHGIMPSGVLRNGDEVWLYYGGWSRRASIPYSNWTGLAISDDGGRTFRKAFAGPVLDRTPQEIFSATAAFVLRDAGRWHSWYASGVEWAEIGGRLEEYYVIKYAHSADGLVWNRENRQLLPPEQPRRATHRPTVFHHDGLWHMYFSHRGLEDFRDGTNSYRIGYASSRDMRDWTRDDARAGLPLSETGWDSKMTAYPYIVEAGGRTYLFYCGNGFGGEGFGYAELAPEA